MTGSVAVRHAIAATALAAVAAWIATWPVVVAAAPSSSIPRPASETTTLAPPPAQEATPPPVPRPAARSVRAPIATRMNRNVTVSCVVSSTMPATLTLEYRRIVRGRARDWRTLAQRVVTPPAAPLRVSLVGRLRTRGLYQIRVSVLESGYPTPVRTQSRRIHAVGPRVVALTFDDGPSGRTTPRVLAALRRADVPATFFVTGRLAAAAPGTTRRIRDEGHLLACHSLAHRMLTRLDDGALASDLATAKHIIERISGRKVTWLRPPYGSTSPRVAAAIRRAGMRQVLWSVDPQDWRGGRAGTIAGHVLSHTRDGSVVLLHDSGKQAATTGRAVPVILAGLKRRGYDFVTLDELAALGYPIR